MHDCAIHDNGMSELEGWEWFDNVTRVISAEKVLDCHPAEIATVGKGTEKRTTGIILIKIKSTTYENKTLPKSVVRGRFFLCPKRNVLM